MRVRLDASFAALSDATRRGVLEQLGRSDASITDLAEKFHMTLTGMKKHVGVLEQAGLVATQKVGRVPPARTSASQERKDTPNDFGAHHRLSSSGLVHASNTMRAGPLKVRVTTSSRSDLRSTVVRFFMGMRSLSVLASIDFLLPFQFLDNLVQLVEA